MNKISARRAMARTFVLLFVLVAAGAIEMLAAQSVATETFRVLHSLPYSNGCNPIAGVARGADGDLYGTAPNGGAYIQGVVFKLSKTGRETVLHNFDFDGGNDGRDPWGNLIQDADGNLYGTTYFGGAFDDGTVFKLSKAGKVTLLHSFTGGPDGGAPDAGLVQDGKGNFYGATYYGGSYGYGVVFKMSPAGVETVLYAFTGGSDGAGPYTQLTRDAKGNLYGITFNGGTRDWGTVFKVSPSGKHTLLYSFTGGADGGDPAGGVIEDASGNLYGTTSIGGDSACYQGCGVIYKLAPSGKETVLYNFKGGTDGFYPASGLIQDAQGNLYGTTYYGGGSPQNAGTVFELSKTGQETVLHHFTGGDDGGSPQDSLIQDEQGNLYGTTWGGGAHSCGTVFKVTP